MSVRRAQREIDAVEFAEWMAYHSLEPWGEDRAGIISSTMANAAPHVRRRQPFVPQDFMPWFDRPAPKTKQTAEDIKQVFRLFTQAAGGVMQPGKEA